MATLAGRDLPGKARALGLRVREMDGWEGRSEGAFDALGVLLHHDAVALGYVNSNLGDNLNVPNNMAQDGANGSQLWIGLDTSGQMTLVFMASGQKWHAGTGSGWGSIPAGRGNQTCVGIETDHTTGTGWPDEMVHYIDVTTRLLCDEFHIDPYQWCAGHREYAPGRKPDPESFDLDAWRDRVANRESKPTATKEWDEMATKEEIAEVVRAQILDLTGNSARTVLTELLGGDYPYGAAVFQRIEDIVRRQILDLTGNSARSVLTEILGIGTDYPYGEAVLKAIANAVDTSISDEEAISRLQALREQVAADSPVVVVPVTPVTPVAVEPPKS